MSLDFIMAKSRYDTLTEDEQEFFYSQLPWMLAAVGIGSITTASIPHIVARLNVLGTAQAVTAAFDLLYGSTRPGTLNERLKRFIGVRTNVGYQTRAEFLRHLGGGLPWLTTAGTTELRKAFDDEFSKEIRAQLAAKKA